MMEKNSLGYSEALIAPCGMNCRVCIGFFGFTMSGKKRKIRCNGCKPSRKSCAHLKKYCEKLTRNQLDYCYECNDFPCKYIKRLDDKYREKYKMSTIENLRFIKEKGMEDFLKSQEERYTCPECNNVYCVHTKQCYDCGWKKENS